MQAVGGGLVLGGGVRVVGEGWGGWGLGSGGALGLWVVVRNTGGGREVASRPWSFVGGCDRTGVRGCLLCMRRLMVASRGCGCLVGC